MDNDSLFYQLYASNIKNRLLEIDNPSDEDKIRWPFELIQNAKDSLYCQLPGNNAIIRKTKVTITLEIISDKNNIKKVIFSHDGPPFTQKTYNGLIYQISQKKNDQSTGKFGTGFLTTHVLSKTVKISGDKIDENLKMTGFSTIIYRQGKTDEDLIQNLKRMERSSSFTSAKNLTQFEYLIETEKNEQCALLGLEHLKKHISNVLINCPDINYIEIIENGHGTKYSANYENVNISQFNIRLYTIEPPIKNQKPNKYIVLANKDMNISVKINDKYEIIPNDKDVESLYAVFPVIGTASHVLPFSLNSPLFKLKSERNALLLHGESDDVSINKNLLMQSCYLYEQLIHVFLIYGCPNIEKLAIGLKSFENNPYESFNKEWYDDIFLKEMRNILASNISVFTSSNNKKLLRDVYFPDINLQDKSINKFTCLNIVKKYYPNIVRYDYYVKWKGYIWSNEKTVTFSNILNIVKKDEQLFEEPNLMSLNEFLGFISRNCKKLLSLKIIPNMNNEFKSSSELKGCTNVSNDTIQIIECIEIEWKSNHLNKSINSIKLIEDDENDVVKEIKNLYNLKKGNKNALKQISYKLIKFVLKNDKKREKMFNLVSKLPDFPFKRNKSYVEKTSPMIWNEADNYILEDIGSNIQQYPIIFLKEFLPIYFDHFKFTKKVNEMKIIPNANNNFKCLNELYNTSLYFNYFSSLIKQLFSIDLNEQIIHPEINSIIQSNKTQSLNYFFDLINSNINDNYNKYISIAELIVAIVPKDNEKQGMIYQIYSHFKKITKITIDNNMINSQSFDKSNKIIILKICNDIESTGSLNNFMRKYQFSEKTAFDILNMLYKFDQLFEERPIFLNKKGQFMPKNELKIDPKIDEKTFDIYFKLTKNPNSIPNFAHSKINIVGIESFDVFDFYKKLNMEINNALSNPNIDDEILKMIKEYTEIDFTTISGPMSSDLKAKMNILQNAHLTFITNRIRELSSPQLSDFQRWPFELIQNATDCIQSQNEKIFNKKKNGCFEFEFRNEKVIFKHYGSWFTNNNLQSIMYQFGEKNGNDKTIGRFGTGFLSTMILSRKVHISGDLIPNNHNYNNNTGFSVLIDRSGNSTDELRQGISDMQESLRTNLRKNNFTQFVFDISENSNDKQKNNGYKAYQEGWESLMQNIPPTLIFNKKIKSIKIEKYDQDESNQATECYIFSLGNDININNDIIIKTIEINDMNNYTTYKKYIYGKTEKIYNAKVITVECLLEIGPNYEIVNNSEFLFHYFPMFGEKIFDSPIIINSPNFEPETERNNIIIRNIKESEENKEDSSNINNLSNINKLIISESVNIYEKIVEYISTMQYNDLFNICYGLKNNSKNEFFQENFILKMRNIISNSNVFEISPQMHTNCNSIIIPSIDFLSFDYSTNDEKLCKDIYKQYSQEFYNIVSKLDIESKYIMDFENNFQWAELLWEDFEQIFDIQDLIKFINKYDDITTIPFKSEVTFEQKETFIYDLILLLLKTDKNHDNSVFGNNKIFLTQMNKLVSFTDIFEYNWSEEIKNIIFDWMDIAGYDYSQYILADSLKPLYNVIKFTSYEVYEGLHEIEDRINEENSLQYIKYVFENDEKGDMIYNFCQIILKTNLPEKISISMEETGLEFYSANIKSIFKKIYEIVFDKFNIEIQNIDVEKNIDLIYDLLRLGKEIVTKSKYDSYRMAPNKNYKLCEIPNLSKDCLENDCLKLILKNTLDLDLNEFLIHEKLNDIIYKEMNIPDASSKILERIKYKQEDKSFYKEDKCELYDILLQYSFKEEYLSKLQNLFNYFYKPRNSIEVKSNYQITEQLTKKIIKMIIQEISKAISEFQTIKEFADCFSNCSNIYDILNNQMNPTFILMRNSNIDDIYSRLPDLYYLMEKYKRSKLDLHKYKIFPDEYNGSLRYLNEIEILYDTQINKENMFKLLDYLVEYKHSNDIKKGILIRQIEITEELKIKFKGYIYDIKKMVDEIEQNFPYEDDSEIKYIKQSEFVRFIKENPDLRIAFAKLLEKIKEDIPLDLIAHMDLFNIICKRPDLIEELEIRLGLKTLNISIDPADLYRNTIIVYEKLRSDSNYKNVFCPILAHNPTDKSIQYNGRTYYLDLSNINDYDISAENIHGEKCYFEVRAFHSLYMGNPKYVNDEVVTILFVDDDENITYLNNFNENDDNAEN